MAYVTDTDYAPAQYSVIEPFSENTAEKYNEILFPLIGGIENLYEKFPECKGVVPLNGGINVSASSDNIYTVDVTDGICVIHNVVLELYKKVVSDQYLCSLSVKNFLNYLYTNEDRKPNKEGDLTDNGEQYIYVCVRYDCSEDDDKQKDASIGFVFLDSVYDKYVDDLCLLAVIRTTVSGQTIRIEEIMEDDCNRGRDVIRRKDWIAPFCDGGEIGRPLYDWEKRGNIL